MSYNDQYGGGKNGAQQSDKGGNSHKRQRGHDNTDRLLIGTVRDMLSKIAPARK